MKKCLVLVWSLGIQFVCVVQLELPGPLEKKKKKKYEKEGFK